jgi:hypothetical protein
MAEITARSAGWKDKSAQKINAACIRRHLSAAVQSGTSIAGTGRSYHLADITVLATYGPHESRKESAMSYKDVRDVGGASLLTNVKREN